MRRLAAAVVACIPLVAAAAEALPTGFRDLVYGATMDDLRQVFPAAECTHSTLCTVRALRFGGLETGALLFLRDGRFTGARASFGAEAYEALRTGLVEKYGPPTTRRTEELRNRAGAVVDNEILEWVGRSVIVIRRFDPGLARTVLDYMSLVEYARRVDELTRGRGQLKDDL